VFGERCFELTAGTMTSNGWLGRAEKASLKRPNPTRSYDCRLATTAPTMVSALLRPKPKSKVVIRQGELNNRWDSVPHVLMF
jgi:hypothetical protein